MRGLKIGISSRSFEVGAMISSYPSSGYRGVGVTANSRDAAIGQLNPLPTHPMTPALYLAFRFAPGFASLLRQSGDVRVDMVSHVAGMMRVT
jgi:hypothetical protein